MTHQEILIRFEALADSLQKEGRAYAKQAGIPEGSKPGEATADQLGHQCSGATYQVCAKAIRNEIKAIKKHE